MLKITTTVSVTADLATQALMIDTITTHRDGDVLDELMSQHRRQTLQLTDQSVHDALVTLGWTPPVLHNRREGGTPTGA